MSERRRTDPIPLGGGDEPYSKGLMARALMRVGVSAVRAYEVARRIERADIVGREHALDAALDGRLRDDVDRGGLDLDEERVRVDALQLLAQRSAVAEVPRHVDDVGVEVVDGRRPGREYGDSPFGQRSHGP